VLQQSKNLDRPLVSDSSRLNLAEPAFRTISRPSGGSLRVAMIPVRYGLQPLVLTVAMPTRDAEQVLANFRRLILACLALSLLATAALSAWYVGKSLAPVAALTINASETSARVGRAGRRALWTPLVVAHPLDELGRLAETFNLLFTRVDGALTQSRQFVSDASHELRTPLSILQGETELVLSSPRTIEEYQKTLRIIDGELKKLTRIVEGLFTLAMADAGELRLLNEPLYLNEVIEDACNLVDARAAGKQIIVEREFPHLISYTGDETFLHELFLILLDNAIKYSPPNTRIRVSASCKDGLVRAAFQDQGFGIPEEDRTRIFERFYRVLRPGADDAHSGGLGLAIAEAITRAHGGTIEYQSKPGVGSTFTVCLPIRAELQESSHSDLQPEQTKASIG
jgi:two-component system OmpR family sensor kinase